MRRERDPITSRKTARGRSTAMQRMSRSAALELYERELAFYRADAPFLTVEKCAERCLKLSMLLTLAQIDTT
jgi:hypothetical protein